MASQHVLLLELRRDDDRLEGLAASTYTVPQTIAISITSYLDPNPNHIASHRIKSDIPDISSTSTYCASNCFVKVSFSDCAEIPDVFAVSAIAASTAAKALEDRDEKGRAGRTATLLARKMYRQVLLTREARANIKRGVGGEGRQISRSGIEEEDPGFWKTVF